MVDWSRQFLENNNLAEPDPLTDTVHTVSQIPVPGSKGGTFLLTYNVPVPLYLYTREVRKYKSNLIHSQTLHRKITFRYLSSDQSFSSAFLGEKLESCTLHSSLADPDDLCPNPESGSDLEVRIRLWIQILNKTN